MSRWFKDMFHKSLIFSKLSTFIDEDKEEMTTLFEDRSNGEDIVLPYPPDTSCWFRECRAEARKGHFCQYHHRVVIRQQLCNRCLNKKDKSTPPHHSMCHACFIQYKDDIRQAAIDQGLCRHYRCSEKATIIGGFCSKHLQEFRETQKRHRLERRQKAIDSHLCTHDGCQEPPIKEGGMCQAHYDSYRQIRTGLSSVQNGDYHFKERKKRRLPFMKPERTKKIESGDGYPGPLDSQDGTTSPEEQRG